MKPVEENIERLLANDLDTAGEQILVEQLAADREAAARIGGLLLTEGLLGVALEDEISAQRRCGQLMDALQRADEDSFFSGILDKIDRKRWQNRIYAIAAMLVIGVSIWMLARPGEVGSVTRLATVSWGSAVPFAEGSALKSGSRLRFASGLVELEMGGRGRVIVEGPADLELAGPMRAILHRGRFLMRVTEAGHGYRVETTKGAVIDLGTEFGVFVDENQKVETHVLDGEVEAIPDGGRRMLLKKNDALRFDRNGGEHIAADGSIFYTALPPMRHLPASVIHWPLEAAEAGRDRAEVRGFEGTDSDMILRSGELGRLPIQVPGVFGSALSFDGKGGFAESSFPGIGGDDPRTVSFWVKVPEDFNVHEGFGIVSWGEFTAPDWGGVWQVSINPLEADGPVGRLRVGAHGGLVIGDSDLRDGRWHHVAVVLYQASQTDLGKHVLIYLDGQLERISRRALQVVDTKTKGASHGVWLGRNIVYKVDHPPNQLGFFRGAVDEVFIFDGALTHDEILRLMERNESPR